MITDLKFRPEDEAFIEKNAEIIKSYGKVMKALFAQQKMDDYRDGKNDN